MEFEAQIYLLSQDFWNKYPATSFPELMYKAGRPYNCLLVDSHEDYFICVPFRTEIQHKNAFHFKRSARSVTSRSGLDYSKIVIIKDHTLLDTKTVALVDKDEYIEAAANLKRISAEAVSYVDSYISHITGEKILHPREFARKYQFSTLRYFHDTLLPKDRENPAP